MKLTLKAARTNAGYSQKAAAIELDISNKTLWKWENGIAFPNVKQVDAICALYGLAYDDINFYPEIRLNQSGALEKKEA